MLRISRPGYLQVCLFIVVLYANMSPMNSDYTQVVVTICIHTSSCYRGISMRKPGCYESMATVARCLCCACAVMCCTCVVCVLKSSTELQYILLKLLCSVVDCLANVTHRCCNCVADCCTLQLKCNHAVRARCKFVVTLL